MKNITQKNILVMRVMRVMSIFSLLVVFIGHSSPIKISVDGSAYKNCEYSQLSFNHGQTPELNIITNGSGCTFSGGDPTVGQGESPTPVYPIGINGLQESGVLVTKPSYYKWRKVPGATFYQLRVFTGTGAYADSNRIFAINLKSDGNAGQIQRFDDACGIAGDFCVYDKPINYYRLLNSGGLEHTGHDLSNGNYRWQIRVAAGDATTDYSDNEASFKINMQVVSDSASETLAEFVAAWTNQRYNPQTFANNFSTKVQLRDLLDEAPYNSYQEIAGNKKVYIINRGANASTIIPSCVNGKNGALQGRNCTVNIPFEINDIFALRLRTKANGQNSYINKASNQLYTYEGALYNIVFSKYPGRMIANQADDFQGKCSITSYNRIGEFSLNISPQSSNLSTHCIIPASAYLYANIELVDTETQCLPGQSNSGYVCQLDVTTNGFAGPQ